MTETRGRRSQMTAENILTLAVALLVSALSGIVATLIGNRQRGKQDIEIANLKGRQDAQIETLRSELAASQQRHQSELDYSLFERKERFRALYEKRREAIYKIYPLAVEVRRAWASLLSPLQVVEANRMEQSSRAYDAANALR